MATAATPTLRRIRMGTVLAPDLAESRNFYSKWLGYDVAEEGWISAALAYSWGAPAMADRPSLLMRSPGSADVFVRFVQGDPVPAYRGLTSFGWSAIEIVVDDVHALHAKLKQSSCTILDEPRPLDGYPSIVAMQILGPSQEALYLTMQSGDRSKSSLPEPGAFVGRPFIAVLAGPDMDAMLDWYGKTFAMARRRVMQTPIAILQHALGLPADHLFPMGTMALAEHGNILEFDGFPAGTPPRPVVEGQLPPGTAMFSFEVGTLDGLEPAIIAPPVSPGGLGYGRGRSATLRGPAGELIELIEAG